MFDFTKQPGKVRLDRNLNTAGQPLVTIITPFYNAGEYFEQTYNCVVNQNFPWFEWVIVNDGSTNENDVEKLQRLVAKDKRIKVFNQENAGSASARNYAIQMASTEYIIPLDADDLIDPTYVEVLYWAISKNTDRCWAYTRSVGFQNQEYLWNKPFDVDLEKRYNFLTNSAIIRKSDLVEVGCYDVITKHYNEDWRLWLKLLSKSKKPIKVGYYGFWYRRRDKGALSIVNRNPEIMSLDKKLIEEAAVNVDTSITAKEYPCASDPGKFKGPQKSKWREKVFKGHQKTHVMMLIPWMEMGGADLFNLEVAKKIDQSRFELSIVTTVNSDNALRQQFEDYVTDIFELPSFLDNDNYAEFISYLIISREIDVIFLSNSFYGYYLVPWLRKEFPEVAIVDYVHMEEWYWRNGGHARSSGVMGKILDKTYVCNERTRRVMINDFGREPESVETVYIGVDIDKYDARKVESGFVKEQLNIEADRPTVLFPCRIHPQKRPFLMIEIAKELKKKIRDIAFIVVGDGPQFEEMKIKVKQEMLDNTIYFSGRQNDMRPYYKDSDVTLICSLKEGLALTAYESLSMSTPVVSSDVGGQSELIDNNVGAILPLMQNESTDLDDRNFSRDEIFQYVYAIENILADSDRYSQLCIECRSRVESEFSSKIMIDKLQKKFENVKMNDSKRLETARYLQKLDKLADGYITIYNEIENYENVYKYSYKQDTRNELIRISNSKWGSRLIKLFFKLKLNKLIR